jgi:hypothetical protein
MVFTDDELNASRIASRLGGKNQEKGARLACNPRSELRRRAIFLFFSPVTL